MAKTHNPKRGDRVRFFAMNDFTGENEILRGKCIGKGSEIRRRYPEEMALAPENYSLIQRDVNGIKSLYVAAPEDVEEEDVEEKDIEEKDIEEKDVEDPIFYHQEDCDCTKCDARRQPGGLDHDPTNDDKEFEKHEER